MSMNKCALPISDSTPPRPSGAVLGHEDDFQEKRLPPSPSTGWPVRWLVLILLLVGICAHWRALAAEFFMDDFPHLLENPSCTEGQWWTAGSRAFSYIFFALIYRLAGPSEIAFHAWNLLLHGAITITLFFTGRRLLASHSSLGYGGKATVAAFFGSLLFACHPLGTEGVNYAQNATLQLVTLFTIGAVGVAFQLGSAPVKPKAVAGLLVLLILARFSKEVGIVYAALSVATALYLSRGFQSWFAESGRKSLRGRFGLWVIGGGG